MPFNFESLKKIMNILADSTLTQDACYAIIKDNNDVFMSLDRITFLQLLERLPLIHRLGLVQSYLERRGEMIRDVSWVVSLLKILPEPDRLAMAKQLKACVVSTEDFDLAYVMSALPDDATRLEYALTMSDKIGNGHGLRSVIGTFECSESKLSFANLMKEKIETGFGLASVLAGLKQEDRLIFATTMRAVIKNRRQLMSVLETLLPEEQATMFAIREPGLVHESIDLDSFKLGVKDELDAEIASSMKFMRERGLKSFELKITGYEILAVKAKEAVLEITGLAEKAIMELRAILPRYEATVYPRPRKYDVIYPAFMSNKRDLETVQKKILLSKKLSENTLAEIKIFANMPVFHDVEGSGAGVVASGKIRLAYIQGKAEEALAIVERVLFDVEQMLGISYALEERVEARLREAGDRIYRVAAAAPRQATIGAGAGAGAGAAVASMFVTGGVSASEAHDDDNEETAADVPTARM